MGVSGYPVSRNGTGEYRENRGSPGLAAASDAMRNTARPTPAKYLPIWARAYFDRWRDRFDNDEMVPVAPDGTKLWWKCHFPDVGLDPGETLAPTHRHDAFYRLLCTDNDDGMRRMWCRADKVIVIDMNKPPSSGEHGYWFMGSIIYGTDAVLPDEKPRYIPSPRRPPTQRLNPEQRAARKVAHLLQCLFHVTPRDCHARRHCYFGPTVEWLVVRYGFYLGPFDYNQLARVYELTCTSDSKRGWIQRRRAHDRIRHQTIAAIRRLLAMKYDPSHRLAAELRQIADDLVTWPDIEAEHGHQTDLLSNKSGWADWLRHVYDEWLSALDQGEARGHLRQCDWAALAAVLFPEHFGAAGAPDERLIREVIAQVEATRTRRQQVERERVRAEEAAFHASRALRD